MKRTKPKLGEQVKKHSKREAKIKPEYEGNDEQVISTGSTLLNLAISGGRIKGGGIPAGILVEIFGPSGAGKTVLLCEIAGAIQRQGGQIMFRDPEARLNKTFAKLFGLDIEEVDYKIPNTIPELFSPVREWEPKPKGKIHGIFADSLAALSTEMEMETGDKMGVRRAKEFSEALRKTCRTLTNKNFLMVCSNQIRQNLNAGPYGQKHISPGGEAIGFYSSLRLRCSSPQKIKEKIIKGKKEVTRVIGVTTQIEVFKSSVWKPYRTAEVSILFDYGIDDIRANLKFIKEHRGHSVYQVGVSKLGNSLTNAIAEIEDMNWEIYLKKEVTELWHEVEAGFDQNRKPKRK